MMEVDVADAGPRFLELLDLARRGEQIIIIKDGDRFSLTPLQPPQDVEAHLEALRRRLAGALSPNAGEFDADVAAMRGRN